MSNYNARIANLVSYLNEPGFLVYNTGQKPMQGFLDLPFRQNRFSNKKNRTSKRKFSRKSKRKTKNRSLYDNGKGSPKTRGMRYRDADSARKSVKILESKNSSKTYKMQVATTMYNRAKYHKYQTKGMRDAMKVWGNYIKKLKKN